MSIAAISSQFVFAVRRIGTPAPSVDTPDPVRAAPRVTHEHGRRHELVNAMNQALGLDATADKATEQAVFKFAHALMHDLRTMVGEESDGPRAWGHRDWGDLAQRLTALATAASQPAAGTTEPVPVPAETPAVPAPAVGTPATPAPELPVQPNPVTTTSAAVHIMKVPSSHLLEAFVALQRALGQAQADATPTDTRTALADMARRLATALAPSGASSVPPGAVVDTSA